MLNSKTISTPDVELKAPLTTVLVVAITALFAVLALWGLGSSNVPKTWFTPKTAGETFTIDLGQDRSPGRLYLYTGIGDGQYQVDISADCQKWEKLCDAKRQVAFIWSWTVIKIPKPEQGWRHGRYLRWTVTTPGEMLFEVAVTEHDSEPALGGLSMVNGNSALDGSADEGSPANLLDEPGTFVYYPDTNQDMIFDEVYHARTAWEHLRHLEPYEWTHPPLGKIIIASGIATLGMDPWGWRLPGVLFGIAMVPLV